MQQAELVRGWFMNADQKAVFLPPLTVNLSFNCKNMIFFWLLLRNNTKHDLMYVM